MTAGSQVASKIPSKAASGSTIPLKLPKAKALRLEMFSFFRGSDIAAPSGKF